jgi:hypothetical protein
MRGQSKTKNQRLPLKSSTNQMDSLLSNYLSRLELREPQACKNIVVIPVFTTQNGGSDYLTLSEALDKKLATIAEVTQSGQVPNVKVSNSSDLRLLLVDGEELIGARQNRTLNTSILLEPKSETVVPVSCTEAGRWAYKTAFFTDAGYVSPHKMRKTKSSSVARSLKAAMGHSADQHAVWGEVAHYCMAVHAQSPTSAMHDAIAAKTKDLDEYLQALLPLPEQKGLIVLVDGEVVGADIVSSARAYRALHFKFVRSYALDALLSMKGASAERPANQVNMFLEAAKATNETVHRVVGCGEDHRFEGQKLAGAGLVADGHMVHLNLYRTD